MIKSILTGLFLVYAGIYAQPTNLELAERATDSILIYGTIDFGSDTIAAITVKDVMDSLIEISNQNQINDINNLLAELKHKSLTGDSVLIKLTNRQAYKSETYGRIRYHKTINTVNNRHYNR